MGHLTREEADRRAREALRKRIESDFTYHPPKDGQGLTYNQIRQAAREFALLIVDLCPLSREQSTALTRLEEAVFHANAAIARHG